MFGITDMIDANKQLLKFNASTQELETLDKMFYNVTFTDNTTINDVKLKLSLEQVYNIIKHANKDLIIIQKCKKENVYFAVFKIIAIKDIHTFTKIIVEQIGNQDK